MSEDDLTSRISRLEWRADALEESQRKQEARMSEMTSHLNARFDQVLDAIHELRDNKARTEGAAEAREEDARKRQNVLKGIGVVTGVVMLLLALGWIRSADGTTEPLEGAADIGEAPHGR